MKRYLLILLTLMSLSINTQAQATILTINISGIVADDILAEFEVAHPGVDVITIQQGAGIEAASSNLENHLDDTLNYVSSADVMLITPDTLSPEATLAGYYLDLQPLIQSDSMLDANRYYPAMWQAFQWNGGTWGLPLSGSLEVVAYDTEAFNAQGLAYPNINWTIDDFANAARMLATYDSMGNVTSLGLSISSHAVFLRALIGERLFDANIIPYIPDFDTPALEYHLNVLMALEQEGVAIQGFDNAPIQIGNFGTLLNTSARGISLFANNNAGLNVTGLAISGGTSQPQLAYELVRFLVMHDGFSNRTISQLPARRDLPPIFHENAPRFNITPELEILEQTGVENGLAQSERLFYDYIDVQMMSGNGDVAQIIGLAQLNAQENWQIARERWENDHAVVNMPIPTAVLGNNEVSLRFFKLDANPAWEDAVAEFVAQDPQVGRIILGEPQTGMEDFDCALFDRFYGNPLEYLDLTPLIQSDVYYNPDDLFPGAMQAVTNDGVVLGYPLSISTDVIYIDVDWFNRMGVPLPDVNWTTHDFILTLQLLKPDSSISAPLGIMSYPTGGEYITPLIMAYSGLPINISTNPPTINLSQPATIEAIRQVLDLARTGYIDFPHTNPYSGGPAVYFDTRNYPMWTSSTIGGIWEQIPPRNLQLIPYPIGTIYTPVSYRVTAGYIRSSSLYPEACYRWLSYLATRPDVVGIPAHISQAQQYALLSGQGESFLSFYEAIRQRASNLGSRIPQNFRSDGFYTNISIRMDRAYREYIFDNIPLETMLFTAQEDTEAYFACMYDVPSSAEFRQMSDAEAIYYDGIIRDCRRAYVPEIMWMYGE